MGSVLYGWSGEASLERRCLNRPEESKAVSLFDVEGNEGPGRGKGQCRGPEAVAGLVSSRNSTRRVEGTSGGRRRGGRAQSG